MVLEPIPGLEILSLEIMKIMLLHTYVKLILTKQYIVELTHSGQIYLGNLEIMKIMLVLL